MPEKKNSRKLKSLLQITQAINNNFSREQLFRIYKGILTTQLGIKRLALYIVESNKYKVEFLEGVSEDHFYSIDFEKYLRINEGYDEKKKITGFNSDFFEYIIPVFHKEKALAFLLIGSPENILDSDNDDEDLESLNNSDLEFIETLSNIVFVALENKKLAKEAIFKEKMKKEIELAAEMQLMLFPSDVPLPEAIDVDAFYIAHEEVGGDYYDYFKLNDEEIVFCIADVSGKGISAALLMSNFQANVRALFPYIIDLEILAKKLNQKVEQSAKGEKFITVFIAKYNIYTRMLTYVNCGHNPPLLYSNRKFSYLKSGTIGLGMMPQLPFIQKDVVELSRDAIIVCYTDGLTELTNAEGLFFGTEKLHDIVKSNHNLESYQINQLIASSLTLHKGKNYYDDDIALLTMKFK